jgi:hypothetical protein
MRKSKNTDNSRKVSTDKLRIERDNRYHDREAKIREQIAMAEVKATTPPDPDYYDDKAKDKVDINQDRSGWAAEALVAFCNETGSDLEDAIADLIGDLGHFCDRHGMDLREQINRGRDFYLYETQNGGTQFDS